VPLLILGGVLFVVLFVGGVGFVVYRAVENAPSRPRDVAEVRPAAAGPAAVPEDGLPGVSLADLHPIGPRPSAPPPGGGPALPGVDPSELQPPGGPPGLPRAERPPGVPGSPGGRSRRAAGTR
jgi:hypothetical protein